MAFARELQQRHYNTRASLPGFDIAGAAYPADETGGDYFDFIPQPDGSLYIVIADIAYWLWKPTSTPSRGAG